MTAASTPSTSRVIQASSAAPRSLCRPRRFRNATEQSGTKDTRGGRRVARPGAQTGSIMLDKPFARRSLLRGAGALTAASLAPWSAGCAPDDDDALTFFFAANPDEEA